MPIWHWRESLRFGGASLPRERSRILRTTWSGCVMGQFVDVVFRRRDFVAASVERVMICGDRESP